MPTRKTYLAPVFVLALAVMVSAACSGAPEPPAAAEESAGQEDGFIELIHRNDSGQYTKHGWNHSGDGYWTLDPETGVFESHGGSGLLWYSARQFSDFVLELEYMTGEVTNSGVFLRMPRVPLGGNYIPEAFEIQILEGGEPGKRLNSNGAIYDCEPPKLETSRGPGEWNEMRITFRGLHLKVELNGVVINDWTAEPRGKVKTHWPKGYIGMQNYYRGDPVRFRNIRIRELRDTE